MDKIAIIADIHGNLEALKTVLNDIDNKKIKHIYCLGDIAAKGVHQSECIKIIKNKCEIVLSGNCDRGYSDTLNLDNNKRKEWNIRLLTDDDRSYLKKLPFSYEFYMSGSLIRLMHATPNCDYGFVSGISRLEEKYSMFLPSSYTSNNKADMVIYGHTHTPYMESIYNRTLINVGSVGDSLSIIRNDNKDANCMEMTRATYLILEGNLNSKEYGPISYQFIKIPYNIESELNNNIYNVEKEDYIQELKEARYRDMDKVYKMMNKNGINKEDI